MRTRSFAALLVAALSIALFSGCAAQAAAPVPTQPVLTVIEEPTVPLAPVPEAVPPTAPPAPTDPASAPTSPARITKEEAMDIALKDAGFTAGQVKGLHAEFDYDDGRPEYEVEFRQGSYEYDYEIHAETGAILHKDIDRED